MKKLLISEVAKKYKVHRVTVMHWIEDGLLPNAALNESGIVSYWEIPETDLQNFSPPKRGRPKQKSDKGEIAA